MRSLLKTFVFVLISLNVTQHIINGFIISGDPTKNIFLVVIALTLLYFFLKPILSIVSLPTKGTGFLFLTFIMTLIIVYVLTLFIGDFEIQPTILSDLIIFGFVLPSKSLTAFWSGVFSSLMISLVYIFFDWLTL